MTVTIRPATPADIPAITRIYAHAVERGTASFELTPPDQAEMARRFGELTTNNFPYLAALVDGALAGYAYAGPYRARPAYRFTVENSIYVAPDRQRHGVGKALLEALIDVCTERGFRLMVAVIGDSNQTASIRLHEAAGFKHVGVFENIGYKFDRWLDSVLMQRALGPGASTPP
ncbi:MAG TPA: GNAT family N-acetyltransferase [Pseudolabrys sp.]|jgi:phosphinothricin acetyltransferase|nr:GNAT family N-acetyltransferase [Pseudolabrys sp.]